MFFNRWTLIIAVITGLFFLISNGGLFDLIAIKKDIVSIKREIKELDNDIKRFKTLKAEASTDKFIENYARTRLGMVKENEIIYEPK